MTRPAWGYWPFTHCPARAVTPEGVSSCDLRRGHEGQHAAERGMYWLLWPATSSIDVDPWGEPPP